MSATVSTRLLILAMVGVVVALGLLLGGCGDDGDEAQQGASSAEATKPVTGTFVGRVTGTNALVAVVAREAQGSDEREVVVYMCDEPFGWFTGSAAANQFSLTAAGRDPLLKGRNAQEVEVQLAPESATGTFRLENGRSLSFRATPASGAAGLYEGILAADRTVDGASETAGKLSARQDVGSDKDTIAGTFAGQDGASVPFSTDGRHVDPGDLVRFVVLADGSFKGKVKRAGTGSSGFSDWCEI